MGKHLIAMKCSERSLGHLSLAFGLLAVGTLSLSVATDFWLFTTEELDPTTLDPTLITGDMSLTLEAPPSSELEGPLPTAGAADNGLPAVVSYDYDDLNATGEDVGGEFDVDWIVVAKVHSGLWRSCIYFDDQGNTPEL